MNNPYEDLVNMMRKQGTANNPPVLQLGVMQGPTTCKIGNLVLKKEDLYINEHLTDYTTDVTVHWYTENTSGGGGYAEFASHRHPIEGRKKILVHNALKSGDVVVVYRIEPQKFAVIAKVV